MKKIKLKNILEGRYYPISRGDYKVFFAHDNCIALSGTILACVNNNLLDTNLELDLDKVSQKTVTYQDYKDEFKNHPLVLDLCKKGQLTEDYIVFAITNDIYTVPIAQNAYFITKYDINEEL